MNAPVSTMNDPAPARSTLVTVLGWLAIACGALGVVAALNQLAFFGDLAGTPAPNMDPALQQGLFRSLRGVAVLNIALSGFLMYAGYALWKRRNWARQTFIVLFALGIAANVIWVVFSALFGSAFAQMSAGVGMIFGVFAIFALAVAGLFYWFIRRLRSPAVKSEFA
jgi:hypothetical protein